MIAADRFWTASNLLSISRAPLGLILVIIDYTLVTPWWLLFIIVIYAILSDLLDGWLARKLNQVTEWGKILDPFSDKITAFILFAYAMWLGRIPVEFFIFSIVRDLSIISGSLYIKKQRGKVPMSVISGKISVNVMALYWILAFFWPELQTAVTILMWLTVGIMAYSWGDYFLRFIRISRGAEFK